MTKTIKNKIILIGGSPTAGKSFTARKLSEELKFPWISTDAIREQMRQIVNKDQYPKLFYFTNPTTKMCVDLLTNNSAKQIVSIQNKESIDVWKGVKAFIETDYVWKSFIVEGVAILPQLAHQLKTKLTTKSKTKNKTSKDIKVIFLIDDDHERIRRTIFTRGLWDDADKYPNNVKEKELEWVIEFNNYILKEAKKYGFPVVKIGDRKKYFKEIKKLIK